MAENKLNKFWVAVIIFLVVVIVVGGILILSRYSPGEPVEISLQQSRQWQGSVNIDGVVTKPGIYPFESDDSIEALIRAAGGADNSANLSGLELYVPGVREGQGAQKIDINRAEVWLLEALPDIGETLAKRIVNFRQQHGLFNNTDEILKVPGIGTTTYEKIKDLITVADR